MRRQGKPTPAVPWLAALLGRAGPLPASHPLAAIRPQSTPESRQVPIWGPFLQGPRVSQGVVAVRLGEQAWGAGTGFVGVQAGSRGKGQPSQPAQRCPAWAGGSRGPIPRGAVPASPGGVRTRTGTVQSLAAGRDRGLFPPCPRSSAVEALQATLLRGGSEDVVQSVEQEGGWESLRTCTAHEEGVARLAR